MSYSYVGGVTKSKNFNTAVPFGTNSGAAGYSTFTADNVLLAAASLRTLSGADMGPDEGSSAGRGYPPCG